MRNKIIAIIILLIAISLLTVGLIQGQQILIDRFYEQMAAIP